VTDKTLFEIGSITKTFTAVAVLQAAERGLLKLQRPVTDYLPWFLVRSPHEPPTLHHLLTHTAGLVGIIDRSPDIRGAVWALRETVAGRPGLRFSYSDAGYQLLTLVLQEITGRPFAEIIREQIFAPLGMTSSEAVLTHAIRPRLAKGYAFLYEDRPPHPSHPLFPATWIETNSGDCCIASTAAELAEFARMLLNQGEGPTGRLLSPASYADMVFPSAMSPWGGYGYGVMHRSNEGFAHIGHGGHMPGFLAEIIADTNNGVGLVMLCNGPRPDGLFWKLMSGWRTIHLGRALDALDLSLPDPSIIENAAEYAGIYQGEERSLTFTAKDRRLFLRHAGDQIPLESRDGDSFYVAHPDFHRFLFQFGRVEGSADATLDKVAGEVVELFYGAEWYAKEAYIGPREFVFPANWAAYPGHYRSHIPWQTNFRVILCKGKLLLVQPDGAGEQLIPTGAEGEFYVGDPAAPERIKFDQIVNGQALRATLTACDYYRFFTP
jgi:CubicO group peptidase (beta-lactamase class C family)